MRLADGEAACRNIGSDEEYFTCGACGWTSRNEVADGRGRIERLSFCPHKCAEYYGCPEFEAHNSLGDAQATAWCWRHVQRDILARGGCDLEAEARDASDASRGVPCPNDPDMGQSAR